ncbi:hypothetical protein [Sphingomonas bacterium]|uniref:hypothetical protein n=1 Tax=Sphingomonas bacterium TaxID=1895847 RepID=UPI0015760C1B|nr:hypothetical protein [Sphingomonas bacterium]
MKRTIFSEKYDYLLAVAALALTFWAFYDMKAAVGGGVILIAVANLQPIQRLGISRNTATLLGVSLLLILSISLKLIDQTGYCYAFFGPQRQGIDFINIQMPCFANNDFYSDVDQPGGMGFVRDIGLPLGGLALGLIMLSNSRKEL